MVEIAGLQKSYGSLKAVDGVSFSITRGETFGLLGPNGAGKTTTISMLVGLLKPDGGTVRIEGGEDPANAPARRRIGVSPQSLAIYDDMTGWENVEFFASLYGFAGARLKSATEAALTFVGLMDRAKDLAGKYSGGMQRRLNLACAIVHEPELVVLDEPTVGVDPQSRNQIFDNIRALKTRGTTILYTTHYMEEAERLCDRVGIMDHGKLLALDTVPELVAKHGGASTVEAEFAGGVPTELSELGSIEGTMLTVRTPKPLETIARIAGTGVPVTTLNLHRASLEDVFLNLTGRSLRD